MIVKIGRVELTEEEAQKIYEEGKYIVAASKIYQVHYSKNAGWCGSVVYKEPYGKAFTRRGRFYVMGGEEVNRMLERELLSKEKEGFSPLF